MIPETSETSDSARASQIIWRIFGFAMYLPFVCDTYEIVCPNHPSNKKSCNQREKAINQIRRKEGPQSTNKKGQKNQTKGQKRISNATTASSFARNLDLVLLLSWTLKAMVKQKHCCLYCSTLQGTLTALPVPCLLFRIISGWEPQCCISSTPSQNENLSNACHLQPWPRSIATYSLCQNTVQTRGSFCFFLSVTATGEAPRLPHKFSTKSQFSRIILIILNNYHEIRSRDRMWVFLMRKENWYEGIRSPVRFFIIFTGRQPTTQCGQAMPSSFRSK